MSTFVAKIDRFVRWFFNVSPLTTAIEPAPEPERPKRRAASRRARSASPTDRRDRPADRRAPRKAHSPRAATTSAGEEA